MLETVVAAILPILVALLLGFVAGWIRDENATKAKAINTVVLHYALPLALFAASVENPRAKLLTQGPLALILLVGMVVPFALAFAVRYKISHDKNTAVLQALGFGFPAIPFVGIAILTPLIGPAAILVVAVGGCVINLILVPITLVVLSLGAESKSSPKPGDRAGSDQSKCGRDQKDAPPNKPKPPQPKVGAVVLSSLKQPIVWAPLGGLALVFCGLPIPKIGLGAVQFLGNTAGPLALFTSGLVLQAEKPMVSVPIVVTTVARNLVIPGTAFLVLTALGVDHELRKVAVLALALPAAALQITLALKFDTSERENASFLLYSNVLSIATIAALMLLLK